MLMPLPDLRCEVFHKRRLKALLDGGASSCGRHANTLLRGADFIPIVRPQTFDLLDYRIRNWEHVVSKDSLAWNGRELSRTLR